MKAKKDPPRAPTKKEQSTAHPILKMQNLRLAGKMTCPAVNFAKSSICLLNMDTQDRQDNPDGRLRHRKRAGPMIECLFEVFREL